MPTSPGNKKHRGVRALRQASVDRPMRNRLISTDQSAKYRPNHLERTPQNLPVFSLSRLGQHGPVGQRRAFELGELGQQVIRQIYFQTLPPPVLRKELSSKPTGWNNRTGTQIDRFGNVICF